MTDDFSDEAKIAKALGLDKVVPELYSDLLKPAAKELGKGLEVTAKAVNLALSPLQGMIWGSEKIKDYLTVSLTKRLRNIPAENIVQPKPNVAGPAIESLKFNGHEPELRELFANLLAASMNVEISSRAHPAFVEIIKQITPDEAKILKHFSATYSYPFIESSNVRLDWASDKANENLLRDFTRSCKTIDLDNHDLIPSYLDNLRRLQIFEITNEYKDDLQTQLDSRGSFDLEEIQDMLKEDKERVEELFFTQLGMQFVEICIKQEQSNG